MERKKLLEDMLNQTLVNCSLIRSEQIPYLENAETSIINAVFEEYHGKRLFLDDVISHLTEQAKKRNVSEDERVIKMLNELKEFKFFLKNLKKGTKGERFASESIDRIVSQNLRLKNIEVKHGNRTTEIDEIVITPKGVFLVEVKFNESDMVITKEGSYVPANCQYPTFDTLNILEKLSERKYYIRSLLDEQTDLSISELNSLIHPVLVFANNKAKLIDKSNSCNVTYCYNIDTYIDNYNCINILSLEQMNEIKNVLQFNSLNTPYDIGYDLENLKKCIVEGIIFIESSNVSDTEKNNEVNDLKQPWKFDLISSIIGSAITSIAIGCSYYAYKKYI